MRAKILLLMMVVPLVLLTACSEAKLLSHAMKNTPSMEPGDGQYKIGKPYKVMGQWYHPKIDWNYNEMGIASWYGHDFHAKSTANGETYDMWDLTAAHPTLPMPSIVRVTNLENGRSINLRVNDRGPFAKNRIIDVSKRAADLLGFKDKGTAKVRVELLREESIALKSRMTGKSREEILAMDADFQTAGMPPVSAQASLTPVVVQQHMVTPPSAVSPVVLHQSAEVERQIYVQLASFKDPHNAHRLRASIRANAPVLVMSGEKNGEAFHRVRVGPLPSVEAADRELVSLTNAGYSGARIIVE